MTVSTKAPRPIALFTGKGADTRKSALSGLAPMAFREGKGRAETIELLNVTLGKKPKEAQIKAAGLEYVIGRAAFALSPAHSDELTVDEHLALTRGLVLNYAAPVAPGAKANKLRAGQLGRRSELQHKAIRAAESAWSLVKAELGFSAAITQTAKNAKAQTTKKANATIAAKATRAPQMKGTATPAAPPVVTPVMTMPIKKTPRADDVCGDVAKVALVLLQYAKRNAKVMPARYAELITTFHNGVMTLERGRAAGDITF